MIMRRFNTMVDQSRHQIFSFALYSLGNREEAEDVTQEVLTRLWEHREAVDGERVLAWTIRVTRNVCTDILRKRRTQTALLQQHTAAGHVAGHSAYAPHPTTDWEQQSFRDRVRRALREIDDPYRTIVILREIKDWPYARIAETVQMPLNTVKVYLHRGRRMLRDRLRAPRSDSREDISHDPA